MEQIYKYIEANSRGMTVDPLNPTGGYGYIDFPENKIRMIFLNTSDVYSEYAFREGEDAPSLIGHRGDMLDALQYLANLCLARKSEGEHKEYVKVVLDIENYREKREQALRALERRMDEKALKYQRNVLLEPMNPYERRLIHTAVQKVNGAISWSEGENLNRHVVIGPDGNVKPRNDKYRGKGNNNRGGRGRYNSKPKYNAEKIDRAPINEGEGMGLYGRIDK